MNRQRMLLRAGGVALLLTATTASADFFQGFESDTSGWLEFGGTVTQVASGGGTLGVTSASGSGHAEVTIGPGTGNGGFTRFGGYSSVWPGHMFQNIDVYIDPAAGSIGDGWFLDNAASDNTGTWTEAAGVGALKATDGFWWVASDGDGGAYPGPASGGVGLQITAADWYTIVSEWAANPDGLTVDINTFIYDSGGTLLYSTFSLQHESILNYGGNNYGWIAGNAPTTMTLAIDNSQLIIPEIENLDTGEVFETIQDAIDDVDTLNGHTLELQNAVHHEGIVNFTKSLTLQGGSVDTVVALSDTTTSGDGRGWFVVDAGVVLDVKDTIFDGDGHLIWQAFRHKGSGSFDNCTFHDIRYQASGSPYAGTAIAAFGDGPVDITNSTTEEIGRNALFYFGSGVNGSVCANNTCIGKGPGDHLDYGIEVGGGAFVTIENNTISGCRGVAVSDGSTSAGILITTFFGGGSGATVTANTLTDNSTALFVGFDGSDTSSVTASLNSISGNDNGIISTAALVAAEDNWWGDASGPEDLLGMLEADNPPCFDPDPLPILDVINFDGLGDSVSDTNVDYCPWLLSPPPTLTLVPDSTCYGDGVGATITVTIHMSDPGDFVVGGQFFLNYDNAVLDFVSAVPGDAPFTTEVFELVDEPGGTIDYAVGVFPFDDPGTDSDTDMAVLTFLALEEICDAADLVTFRSHVPPTRLTNDIGGSITVVGLNLEAITIDGTPPDITPPTAIEVNADAGGCTADVTVPALSATDNCGVIASIVNDYNGTADASDNYPEGLTTITWTVTDPCGNESMETQDITVNAVNDLTLDLSLSGAVTSPLTRCITLELWDCPFDSGSPATIVDIELTFVGGVFSGTIEVPCGPNDYTCITARDTLHTLRRTLDPLPIVGTGYVADFVTAGKPLLGGNLNDDLFVDILDFGAFVGEFGVFYDSEPDTFPDGNTICGVTLFPHADVNGDGTVDSLDFGFITINFLVFAEANCCGAPFALSGNDLAWSDGRSLRGNGKPGALRPDGPITDISLSELRRLGLGHLAVADLNHDKRLNHEDVAAFLAGARP